MEFLLLRPKMVTRDVLEVLNTLTETKKLTISDARRIIDLQISRNHYTYCCYVDGQPIAIGSIIILNKLGKNGGRSCLIEDVAVKSEFQRNGYGKSMIEFLCKKAQMYNVYKIILDCSVENEEFYKKCGFYNAGYYMRKDC